MDYLPIFNTALSPLWWLVPFMLVIGILRSPWFKGATGEALVRLSAHLWLPSDAYHSVHNVTLQTPDGSTQIDHILVSRFGVFVVETKHMKGWIFGSERDAQWTQKIHRASFQFQNPLRQNYKHVKALEAILEVPENLIHSIVVFTGASTFKTPVPANVMRGGRYIGFIKSFQQQVFSNAQVEEILSRVQATRLPETIATRRKHIESVRYRRDPALGGNCPLCGNRMVLRTAKQGKNAGRQFWGCSTFPRCKAVQPVA